MTPLEALQKLVEAGERLVATLHAGPFLLHADADVDSLQAALDETRLLFVDSIVASRDDVRHALGTCGCHTHIDHRDKHLPAVTRLRKDTAA